VPDNIFDFLDQYDGFVSSFKAKHEYTGEKDTTKMTYGEFNKTSFDDALKTLKKYKKLDKTEDVIDIGSGLGKLVIAFHSTGMFKSIYGVEILKGLKEDSEGLLRVYSETFNKNIDNVNIFNRDALDIDISNYDVIISNTSIDNDFLDALIKKIDEEAKVGAVVVSTINQFIGRNLKLLERFNSNFSWGASHINFSVKA
jgi:2-polyprenyl-3-methyl-5-hydroxy-6-metoxy-1,4-benzoquinol methylase